MKFLRLTVITTDNALKLRVAPSSGATSYHPGIDYSWLAVFELAWVYILRSVLNLKPAAGCAEFSRTC